jgi:TadE-like protein
MIETLRNLRTIAIRRLAALPKETDGAEIAEAAVVLPLLFLLLFAIIWFARAFNIYSTVTTAAREGARFAAHPTCATCAAPGGGGWTITNLPDNGAVTDAVKKVLYNSHIDPGPIQLYTPAFLQSPALKFCTSPPAPPGSCSVATNITVCRFVLLNPPPSAQPEQCGTAVSFQYPFGSYFPFPSYPTFTFRTVLISAEGQSEMQY